MTQPAPDRISVIVCWLSDVWERPPAVRVSRRRTLTAAVDPRRSIESTLMSTLCDATARKLSSRRRCSAAERFGFTVLNASRSFASIARAYADTARRITASSSSTVEALFDAIGAGCDGAGTDDGFGASGGGGGAGSAADGNGAMAVGKGAALVGAGP